MNILFFIRHFTERGTEIAIYDYANYNETILKNKSYIICFTDEEQQRLRFPLEKTSYDKFDKRFEIIKINNIQEISKVIDDYKIDYFYTLTHGGGNDIYQFTNNSIWKNCKTIKHAVFNTTNSEGANFYLSISHHLNKKYRTNLPVINHIVSKYDVDTNLRDQLNIPHDALVLGRYGGSTEFNIPYVHTAIKEILNIDPNIYFLFMNTNKFYDHERIIYLNKNLDNNYKTQFVNSCDAMIHARQIGETFGLSIGEFSIRNKPVITCKCGDLEHLEILKDKAIVYQSYNDLMEIFKNIRTIIKSRDDWNAYDYYNPQNIMELFNQYVFHS